MSQNTERPTPSMEDTPGAWPATPAASTPGASRTSSYQSEAPGMRTPVGPAVGTAAFERLPPKERRSYEHGAAAVPAAGATTALGAAIAAHDETPSPAEHRKSEVPSDTSTVVPSPYETSPGATRAHPTEEIEEPPFDPEEEGRFAAIKAAPSENPERPKLDKQGSNKPVTEEDLFRSLSRRKSGHSGDMSRAVTQDDQDAEQQEIEKLMSRMFGKSRQAASEEEKTRHVGVVWKNLTVKGMGLGAALQPTAGDIFLGPLRFIKSLLTKGPRKAAGKPPVRTILNNFNGCIKPGEMCLVLGRPGAGCSTFLKIIGNQRFGYEDIQGDVTYGGTDSKTMGKKYRGEVVYNPEDDLHYATLSVQQTLKFALKTRTPGKESRKEGESRADYINEFLRVVSKLFWIEHTMGTKVGNEFVRGVSGGERKRVSIAEAMITRASVQAWDNRYAKIPRCV